MNGLSLLSRKRCLEKLIPPYFGKPSRIVRYEEVSCDTFEEQQSFTIASLGFRSDGRCQDRVWTLTIWIQN